MAEYFDSSSAIVKAKINALRAQLVREMAKVSKIKSGQATDEKYVSKWIFCEQLKLLRPLIVTTKSQESISTQNNDFNDSVSLPERTCSEKKASKNYHCREKIRESMEAGSSVKQPTNFALLIEKKLGRLSQTTESWIF